MFSKNWGTQPVHQHRSHVKTAAARRRRTPITALAALMGVTLFAASCAPTPVAEFAAAPQGTYKLDPNHASVIWRVGHLNGLSRFVGRFDTFDAALDFDPAAPEAARLTASITAESINTGLPEFDTQIANHDSLLNADQFPEIRFESARIDITGDNTAIVQGDLSLRGETAPITLDVVFNGTTRDPLRRGARVIGFSATGTVNRSDFGADAYVNFGVSDAVDLLIEAEFIRQSGES